MPDNVETSNKTDLDDIIKNVGTSYTPSVFSLNDVEEETKNNEPEIVTNSPSNEMSQTQFPGEIIPEEPNMSENKLNFRHLDIFTINADANLNDSSNEVSPSDLVETFQLESDYDYNKNIYKSRYDVLIEKHSNS